MKRKTDHVQDRDSLSRLRGNLVSLGHQALTMWAFRWDSLGAQSINICGRMYEEGPAGAACRSAGSHGDPTLSTQHSREALFYIDRAVKALVDSNQDAARAVAGHYLKGLQPVALGHQLGVGERRAKDLLDIGRSWVGARLEQTMPQHIGWGVDIEY